MKVDIRRHWPVGAMVAWAVVMCGVGYEIVLVDINKNWVQMRRWP